MRDRRRKQGIQEEEAEASADDLLIGLAVRLNDTDFAGDKLRLGLTQEGLNTVVRDRTPGHSPGTVVKEFKAVGRRQDDRIIFEAAIPRSLISRVRGAVEDRLVLSLSFPSAAAPAEQIAPEARGSDRNSFAYQVRFGGDALIPIYFVELQFESNRNRR